MTGNSNIYAAANGQKHNVLEIVRRNPRMAAGISKLLAPASTKRERTTAANSVPNTANIRGAAQALIDDQRDSRNILNMMPDIEMSMRVLVAAILNPKDMTTTELTYSAPTTRMDGLLSNGLIELVRAYFDDVHKIKPQLPKILRNALVLKGAHPTAVIPENSLDAIINAPNQVSVEALSTIFSQDNSLKTVGIIGPSTKQLKAANHNSVRSLRANLAKTETTLSLEGLAVESGAHRQLNLKWKEKDGDKVGMEELVTFHDNPNILKLPIVREQLSKISIEELYMPKLDLPSIEEESLGLEAAAMENNIRRLSFNESERVLYKKRSLQMRVQAIMPTQDQLARPSVAEPLVIDLPYEAVFPVFLPGEEHKHVAYIVLVDHNGYFVTDRYTDAQIREMAKTNNPGQGSFSSALVSRMNMLANNDQQQMGISDYLGNHLEYCARVYGELIESDFVDRVSNGRFNRTVSLSDSYDLGRIMLARRLAEQQTQILFLPRELVTYFAFDYRKDGVGQSIIDQIKPMLAMRMALMMGNLLGQLKNSIGRTKIHAKLDEDDADPLETKEKIIDEVIRSRQLFANFPSRVQGPVDVLNYLASAGIEFTWEEHPSLPNIQLDVSYENTDHTLPSGELEEEYKKRTILKFGIPPEQVDAALGPDFAVQAINNNVMFAKQVMQRQTEFCEILGEHLKRIIRVTPSLYGEMIQIVERNLKHVKLENVTDTEQLSKKLKREIAEKLVREFVDGLTVGLPSPNSITHRNQIESMKDYSELLDEALNYFLNPEFLTEDTVGVNLADRVDVMRASVKALNMREYMAAAGITPELAKLGLADSDGRVDSVYDKQLAHARQVMDAFTNFFEKIQDPKAIADARIERNTSLGEGSGSASSDTGGSETPPGDIGGLGEDMPNMDESVLGGEGGDETAGTGENANTNPDEGGGSGSDQPEESSGQPAE